MSLLGGIGKHGNPGNPIDLEEYIRFKEEEAARAAASGIKGGRTTCPPGGLGTAECPYEYGLEGPTPLPGPLDGEFVGLKKYLPYILVGAGLIILATMKK